MLNGFEDTHFKWTFRNYQQRVLDEAETYLKDGKIHIVAAPGSGKTILGLELIRSEGFKTLVLSPSIAIRQQWMDRFAEAFLNKEQLDENWCSENIDDNAMITSMTYQGLFAAMNDDPQGFIKKVKKAGIKSFCFDEAHHLKRQWWRVLDTLANEFPENIRICLTATPPYDCSSTEWNNYINLCGDIDCEISIPELVKEKSLCPHQDYVYLSLPVQTECSKIRKIKGTSKEFMAWLMANDDLKESVESHPIFYKKARKLLFDGKDTEKLDEWEVFLDYPDYLTGFLVYCKEANIQIKKNLRRLMGTFEVLPKINVYWMEKFLQGYLFLDPNVVDDDCKNSIITRLKRDSLMIKNKLYLDKSKKINKILIKSQGKFEAIADIVRSESEKLGDELRLLILTDYIKKDAEKEIGALPIYKYLKKKGFQNICLLTGNYMEMSEDIVYEASEGNESKQSRPNVLSQVRDDIASGKIKIIVGTVSYLGEGWDAPWINSLILATTVRSYVSSNQMRGRAIRYLKDKPDKTSAIWHLLSMDNTFSGKYTASEQIDELAERFTGFMGLSQDGNVITNGIERLNLPMNKLSKAEVATYNDNVLNKAGNRRLINKRWQNALILSDGSSAKEKVFVHRKVIVKNFHYYNALLAFFSGLLSFITVIFDRIIIPILRQDKSPSISNRWIMILLIGGVYLSSRYGYKLLYKLTPQSRFNSISAALLNAMIKKKIISSDVSVVTEENGERLDSSLLNATLRENTEYAKALTEFFGPIDNPRYILMERMFLKRTEYYPVPYRFASKREDVELLLKELNVEKRTFRAHYLRNPKGRKILLRARFKAYSNIQKKFTGHNRTL